MRRFEGRAALVTGAGRRGGIGEAIARRLAAEGARVAVVDLCRDRPEVPRETFGNWERLQEVAESLSEIGERGLALKADVTDEGEVAEMFALASAHLGRLDALFNNAGGGTGAGPVDRTNVEALDKADWDYTISVSLSSVMLCTKHAIPHLAASGNGAIVNTTSISAYHGVPGLSAYSAAKFAVTALTRTLALELAPRGVRVNAFAPGMTLTPYVRQRFAVAAAEQPGSDPAELLRRAGAGVPLGRAAEPAEMAAVAAFLASDDASYMTGQTLFVDGGTRV